MRGVCCFGSFNVMVIMCFSKGILSMVVVCENLPDSIELLFMKDSSLTLKSPHSFSYFPYLLYRPNTSHHPKKTSLKKMATAENQASSTDEHKLIRELTMRSDIVSMIARVWRKWLVYGRANPAQTSVVCFLLIDAEVSFNPLHA